MLETKLKYGVKDRDHILSLPKWKMITNDVDKDYSQ